MNRMNVQSRCEEAPLRDTIVAIGFALRNLLACLQATKEKMMERYRTVHSPGDSLPLDVVEVIPDTLPVKALVQIVHGIQEHKERYLHFMRFLASRGIASVAADHRGHGKSIRQPEDLGYFYDDKGEAIVEDLDAISANLRLEYPHVPFAMIAHSMGTLVARKYLKKHDGALDALILSGPVWENPNAKAGRKLVDVLARLMGDRYISKYVARLVEGSFDKGIPGTQKNRWLNTCEERVEEFNSDPLCGQPFTLNGYHNLLLLVEDVYAKEGWQAKNPDLPILFAAGEQDPVIGSPAEFVNQGRTLRDNGYTHIRQKLYPHMRHEILNEVDREHVYEDFYNFLQEIIL